MPRSALFPFEDERRLAYSGKALRDPLIFCGDFQLDRAIRSSGSRISAFRNAVQSSIQPQNEGVAQGKASGIRTAAQRPDVGQTRFWFSKVEARSRKAFWELTVILVDSVTTYDVS